MEKTYSAKVYGVVCILPRVDYNLDNICCDKLKAAIENNSNGINLINNKFQINNIELNKCVFCQSELEVIQTDKFVDKEDETIVWKKENKD